MLTRRNLLQSAVAALPALRAMPAFGEGDAQRPLKMGIAYTSYMTVWRPKIASELLEHSHKLGAGGIQTVLNGDLPKLKARAEELGMYLEGMVSLPKNGDTSKFEQQLKDAQTVNARCVRCGLLGGRRYETFSTLADWQAHVDAAHKSIEAALPLLDKYKIPLALENHKDWTIDEHIALLKHYSNPYLGACIDFGNNISLLDDPMEVIERLIPHAVATHLKNMGVQPYPEGFLLSEVLLGDGFLDLPKVVGMLQQAKPKVNLSLEMITRDPLKVPCLTDKYWATFPHRNGIYLARTLTLVREKASSKPLPSISQLSREQQLAAEESNVVACLDYARKNLNV
jgi:sugar phosphate isomerase/epimerase